MPPPPPSSRPDPAPRTAGSGQRQHILAAALTLMAQHGVDGTSMRDLAAATGLNVATLYHYFPSKRDLLVAVLEEQGFLEQLAPAVAPAMAPAAVPGGGDGNAGDGNAGGGNASDGNAGGASSALPALTRDPATGLAELLADLMTSMLQVEEFIRLMLGEVLRGDETAHAVGVELFDATRASLEQWLDEVRPDLCGPEDRIALARVLRALIVGFFFEHVAGVLVEDDDSDPAEALRAAAVESAAFFERRAGGPGPA